MRIGLDSYSYHRFFGEWYPGLQDDPGRRMTFDEFLERACTLGVAGVSIESCFMHDLGSASIDRIRDRLDLYGFERVWAWGHLDGLSSGSDANAEADLKRHLGIAEEIGAKVMRIVGGSRRTRPASWADHKARLVPMLQRLVGAAERHGVVMAIENHIDLYCGEMLELLEAVNSQWLGVCLDTANNLRLGEDPVAVARALAPYARATHVKDIARSGGDPREFASWPSVPLGSGEVDLPAILAILGEADYAGLLAIEIDYLHPDHGDEDDALARSVAHLRALLQSKRNPEIR
jgi:3-oxoisoapionate decarboxylase